MDELWRACPCISKTDCHQRAFEINHVYSPLTNISFPMQFKRYLRYDFLSIFTWMWEHQIGALLPESYGHCTLFDWDLDRNEARTVCFGQSLAVFWGSPAINPASLGVKNQHSPFWYSSEWYDVDKLLGRECPEHWCDELYCSEHDHRFAIVSLWYSVLTISINRLLPILISALHIKFSAYRPWLLVLRRLWFFFLSSCR